MRVDTERSTSNMTDLRLGKHDLAADGGMMMV